MIIKKRIATGAFTLLCLLFFSASYAQNASHFKSEEILGLKQLNIQESKMAKDGTTSRYNKVVAFNNSHLVKSDILENVRTVLPNQSGQSKTSLALDETRYVNWERLRGYPNWTNNINNTPFDWQPSTSIVTSKDLENNFGLRSVETKLTINTTNIRLDGDYTIEAKDIITTFSPGRIETISILDLTASDIIILTIPGGDEGTPLQVVFNIQDGEIINLHGRIEYEDEFHDTYFNNEQYFKTTGTTLTIYDTPQSDVVESNIYLELENGLVFSPNGDGLYDELSLFMSDDFNVTNVEITSLDGTVIYTTTDKTFRWNGTVDDELVNPDVYNYSIQIDDQTIQGQFLIQY